MEYLFIVPIVLGLANLLVPIKYWKYRDRDWYQDNLVINILALAICWTVAIAMFLSP